MEMIMIKDAAKNLGVESHVLRYWEEELGLLIKRNSMGHRYYDERDIKMFQEVKDLRDRGFSLKDIKDGIEKQKEKMKEEQEEKGKTDRLVDVAEDGAEDIRTTESKLVKLEAVKQVATVASREIPTGVDKAMGKLMASDKQEQSALEQLKVVDFKTAQLQTLMNKIVANALKENKDIIASSIKSELTTDVMRQFDAVMREKEEKEEERYRRLDETIRALQRSNEEVAATRVGRGLFSRKKK